MLFYDLQIYKWIYKGVTPIHIPTSSLKKYSFLAPPPQSIILKKKKLPIW